VGLNSYEFSTASGALQCTTKTCNCISAQRWCCAVSGIRAIDSSCSLHFTQS